MKTPKQISEYVQGKYWSAYFLENIKTKASVRGRNGKWTIKAAFDWEKTEQGSKYWELVDREFTEWYESSQN